MDCPKCHQEMGNYEVSEHDYVICENKSCEYWGILRLDLDDFGVEEDEGQDDSELDVPPSVSPRISPQSKGAVPPLGDDAADFI